MCERRKVTITFGKSLYAPQWSLFFVLCSFFVMVQNVDKKTFGYKNSETENGNLSHRVGIWLRKLTHFAWMNH